jgi:hypothetical protein
MHIQKYERYCTLWAGCDEPRDGRYVSQYNYYAWGYPAAAGPGIDSNRRLRTGEGL